MCVIYREFGDRVWRFSDSVGFIFSVHHFVPSETLQCSRGKVTLDCKRVKKKRGGGNMYLVFVFDILCFDCF